MPRSPAARLAVVLVGLVLLGWGTGVLVVHAFATAVRHKLDVPVNRWFFHHRNAGGARLMRLVTRGLNRNERLIIILYYYEDMTMKEIGATLDLSESRVSQMHSSIVARLQAQLAKRQPEFST